MAEKIKVVWICNLSNQSVRDKIQFSRTYYRHILGKLLRKPLAEHKDYAQWVTNAIIEFEKFEDIDLTIIFPQNGIKGEKQFFSINGIKYICYRSESDNLFAFVKRKITGKADWLFRKNRELVSGIIENVKPDVVHMIGAENPPYSITLLDVPHNIPTILSIQTLLMDPKFKENYPMSEEEYRHFSEIERQVIIRSDYIAQRSQYLQDLVRLHIKSNPIFLKMPLALGVTVDTECTEKKYDFVYFARIVTKAADYAVEAMGEACKFKNNLTLNICGQCPDAFKAILKKRCIELGIEKNVFFTDAKETHDEVMAQIKLSRFALLPLKVDLISGTIREAMASGLPVVTTETPGTPKLNAVRESILISKIGDHMAMANNMLRLIDDKALANKLKENAIITVSERYSNITFMKMWRDGYYAVINHFNNNVQFPENVAFPYEGIK